MKCSGCRKETDIIDFMNYELTKQFKTCIECRTKDKAYHEKNKEKQKQKNKEYRYNNKEKEKQRKKEYADNNKDKRKEYIEKIKQENPLKFKIRNMISHSKEKDKIKNRTYDDIDYVDYDFLFGLWNTQDGKCFYCKCDMELTFMKHTREPKQITLQRTNNDIAHIKSNVVLSCFLCNCVLHMEYEV